MCDSSNLCTTVQQTIRPRFTQSAALGLCTVTVEVAFQECTCAVITGMHGGLSNWLTKNLSAYHERMLCLYLFKLDLFVYNQSGEWCKLKSFGILSHQIWRVVFVVVSQIICWVLLLCSPFIIKAPHHLFLLSQLFLCIPCLL